MSRGHPTRVLAQFASGLRLSDIPPNVVFHAKLSMLDTLGCGLQGSTLEWTRIAQRVAEAEGGRALSTVWGSRIRVSPTQGAWINGTAGHAFEFDDVHMGGMFHPGSLTVSAALAVGEPAGIDGSALVAAVVAGCEVAARVGRAVGTRHFLSGYHPQGTIGVFASAAAAARVLHLDAEQTHQAFGIAASHAAGLMGAQRGAMVKRLHSGHAAQSGVVSALLAKEGFTGTSHVLEAEFGGFCATMGGGDVDLHQLTDGLGSRWETSQIAFKPFPSCAAAQASIEAARLLRQSHQLAAGDVARVLITTSEHVRTHSGWPYVPEGVTAAQMSIGYGVARMLADGSVEARHFTDESINDAATLDMARRIEVVSDPAIDQLGSDRRYRAVVTVLTTDGRELRHAIDDRPGNTSNPMAVEQLQAKFLSLAAPVIGSTQSAALSQRVMAIESAANLGELLETLTPADRALVHGGTTA